jgi:NAD(P)H-flavin reductase
MAKYEVNEYFHDFAGPLGNPADFVLEDIEEWKSKKILFVAGGVGTAPNPMISSTTKGLELNKRGCIIVNEES